MRKLLILSLLFFITFPVFSQSLSLKGMLRDSSENRSLANTVISILRKKDSVLVKFIRADKDGNFNTDGLKSY